MGIMPGMGMAMGMPRPAAAMAAAEGAIPMGIMPPGAAPIMGMPLGDMAMRPGDMASWREGGGRQRSEVGRTRRPVQAWGAAGHGTGSRDSCKACCCCHGPNADSCLADHSSQAQHRPAPHTCDMRGDMGAPGCRRSS